MNGKKKVEVRKGTALYKAIQKLINEYGFADIYVYCCKINKKHYHLIESIDTDTGETGYEIDYYIGSGDYLDYCYEGKVAFKFRCYKVEKYTLKMIKGGLYFSKSGLIDFPNEEAQLDNFELLDYAGEKLGTKLYAIHISDLKIFDKPKELSEFIQTKRKNYEEPNVKRPPQSWCYVESEN